MSLKYFVICVYYFDKETEIIQCDDEKELKDIILEDLDGFDLGSFDKEFGNYEDYNSYMKSLSINDLKNKYLTLVELSTKDSDFSKILE
jgi:hypothetical protein